MPIPTINFTGGDGQERQWVQDAFGFSTFPWDLVAISFNFSWVEEIAVEPEARAVTTVAGTVVSIVLRNDIDQPDAPSNQTLPDPEAQVKPRFMETIMHEAAGHGFVEVRFGTNPEREVLAGFFVKDGRTGVLADWSGTMEWEDRIVEAMAEFMKDVYLPRSYRVYDQRTRWAFQRANWATFLQMIEEEVCPPIDGRTARGTR